MKNIKQLLTILGVSGLLLAACGEDDIPDQTEEDPSVQEAGKPADENLEIVEEDDNILHQSEDNQNLIDFITVVGNTESAVKNFYTDDIEYDVSFDREKIYGMMTELVPEISNNLSKNPYQVNTLYGDFIPVYTKAVLGNVEKDIPEDFTDIEYEDKLDIDDPLLGGYYGSIVVIIDKNIENQQNNKIVQKYKDEESNIGISVENRHPKYIVTIFENENYYVAYSPSDFVITELPNDYVEDESVDVNGVSTKHRKEQTLIYADYFLQDNVQRVFEKYLSKD